MADAAAEPGGAGEASRAQQAEWELAQLERIRQQEEARADEDDELLYTDSAQGGGAGEGGGQGGAYNASMHTIHYLLQQNAQGLENTQELAALELKLLGEAGQSKRAPKGVGWGWGLGFG